MPATAILDVGKTNIKLLVLDGAGRTVWSRSRRNQIITDGPYPHFEMEDTWLWVLDALAEAAAEATISAINVSAHGSCVVLLDDNGEPALPVLDYEYRDVDECDGRYGALRPDFGQTFSPRLAGGLNIGKQLFWLKEKFPQQFSRVKAVLLLPQYWVWRLSGTMLSERTSLGCHTDLWLPLQDSYSPLLDALDLRAAMPALMDARDVAGTVTAQVSTSTALPTNCRVYAGVHDSNASFARYLHSDLALPFTVVSTGTWVVTMSSGASLQRLAEALDVLANVSVLGEPLACARFMGGREFDTICRLSGARPAQEITEADINELVQAGHVALPSFEPGTGPFGNQRPALPEQACNGKALATAYLALMVDYELDLLGATGSVVLGSSSRKNPLFCRLLAQLNPQRNILLSGDEASTARGAWCLTRWQSPPPEEFNAFEKAMPTTIVGLLPYRDRWRLAVASDSSVENNA